MEQIKASDYIVEFLISKGITDVFGYPGGMVTHLMESLDKYSDRIRAHLNYHEQASAMAACGWAEVTGLPGLAYATSGPGATNLLTGIACAYFESLPCIFITGQVNTYEQKKTMNVRQRGFQETDIVSMAKPVTKDAFMVNLASELPEKLQYAYDLAMTGRKGPVLIDIPMDVFRGKIDNIRTSSFADKFPKDTSFMAEDIIQNLINAKRPVILAGHGISLSGTAKLFGKFVDMVGIPTVTSMIAIDTLPSGSPYNYGMIGAYGSRWANYILNHSDCVLTLGSRLDCRQTGVNKHLFAPDAKILRVDVDEGELENKAHDDEKQYVTLLEDLMPCLLKKAPNLKNQHVQWNKICLSIKNILKNVDAINPGNEVVKTIGEIIPDFTTITTDVGQNQVWIAQSMPIKQNQRVLFSGGHGAMGYSIPAGIGAAIASKGIVICCVGDGGFQMNIQELECIVRERLPLKIILFNNRSLGMIHHFQEMYFRSNYVQTDDSKGYTVPNCAAIANAYGIRTLSANNIDGVKEALSDWMPAMIVVDLPQATHVIPKLGLNQPIHIQEPALPKEIISQLDKILMSINVQ